MIEKKPQTVLLDDNATGKNAKQRNNINAFLESCSVLCAIFLALRVGGCRNNFYRTAHMVNL